jgi:hypothetical protein
VITLAQDLAVGGFFPSVSPEQLYGIEVNEYAHELAQITVWIGYIQWLRDNGFGAPSEPILKPLDTIQRMDALLTSAADGSSAEPPWPATTVIVGNPPFLGGSKLRRELGDNYVDAVFPSSPQPLLPHREKGEERADSALGCCRKPLSRSGRGVGGEGKRCMAHKNLHLKGRGDTVRGDGVIG